MKRVELAAKKQTTRLIRVACPRCIWTARTTQKHIDAGLPTCHCGHQLEVVPAPADRWPPRLRKLAGYLNKKTIFLAHFKNVLMGDLAKAGIRAKVEVEAVPTTKLHRIFVFAPEFRVLKHSERQNLVWRIADRVLDADQQLLISMIITLTPDEAKGAA